MDGHHKLVRWRMVIHGAMDGFSRAVMFLKCSTNNQALTVLTLFEDAIQKFNVPARIRCDHGTENIQVAKWIACVASVSSRGSSRKLGQEQK